MPDNELIWTPRGGNPDKLAARALVVAPRMPRLDAAKYTGNPFTSAGDVYAECGTDGCGWKAMGERAHIKLAMDEHRRMYHSEQTGVVLLNHPRQ